MTTESRPARETPLDLSLDRAGTVLVEASAGTGKTHALTTLVARLVVEEGRAIDEILVVTFTRAATAELRDRIRRTLAAACTALRGAVQERPVDTEAQARDLLERWRGMAGVELAPALRHLEAALQDIDLASVHTIHGFCQRVLHDLAFEGAFPFGFEVSGDDPEVTAGAVRDFWRRRLHDAPLSLVRHAADNDFLPRALAKWADAGRTKPGLRIAGAEAPARAPGAGESEWRSAFEAARAAWAFHGSAFRSEMLEGTWLNRNRYRRPRVEERLALLKAALAAPEPRLKEVNFWGWFGREALAAACKKGHEPPDNPLFDALENLEAAAQRLRTEFDEWLRAARGALIAELRETARQRTREERRLRYDDLLIEVEAALRSRSGARLAQNIRRAYPCALIDEYQDTDQVQAHIFARVYGAPAAPAEEGAATRCSLFVVGDPKQSIYRFRGADIFAYLGTRQRAERELSLDRNWRSVPALVAAVNTVFAAPLPFVIPEIAYRPVSAARTEDGALQIPGEEEAPPFVLRLLPPGETGKPLNRGAAGEAAVETLADEIFRLLGGRETGDGTDSGGREGPGGGATLDGRPLRGSDVAVLVRTRSQGQDIAAALRARGVRATELGDDNVFATCEAERLERFLRGLAELLPVPEARGALAGDLFALDTPALHAMEEDDEVWSEWRERLRAWREEWETRGVGALLLRLLEHGGGAERLLRYRDGARRLTNYRHLAELLLDAEAERRLSPAGLVAWLRRRREQHGRDENLLLRLDSDEQLVRILTVHGSKGLEFPVVFCPFAWHHSEHKRIAPGPDALYHERTEGGYREVLDLHPDPRARDAERREEISEALRLLYVAFTRAQYRCVVTWGRVKDAGRSPLAWLLHRGPEGRADAGPSSPAPALARAPHSSGAARERRVRTPPEEGGSASGGDAARTVTRAAVNILDGVAERFDTLDWSEWREEVEDLARRCPEGIAVSEVPAAPHYRAPLAAETPVVTLAVRRPVRALRRTRQMTSFSALSAEGQGGAGVSPDRLTERPDHDGRDAAPPRPEEDEEEAAPPFAEADARSVFTFPRGAAAGSCLHRIFEHLDRRPAAGPAPDLDGLCRDALRDFGFEDVWRPVVRTMVEHTRAVRLHDPGGKEAAARTPGTAAPGKPDRIPPSPAARPAAGAGPSGEAAGNAEAGGERRRAAETGFRLADPVRRIVEMEFHFPVAGLARSRLAACLAAHGYPAPFEASAGDGGRKHPPIDGFLRGFVDLTVEHGGRWYIIDYKSNWLGADSASYDPTALRRATFAGGYPLQYLIYLVALHRHLGTRLAGYDYERHIGGVFYLFLRGMDPAAGMKRGVYFDRPPRTCIEALDACFRGEGRT